MARLEEPFRTVVLLRYFEGLSVTAIAARLGTARATVRTRLFRGLARLRARLRDERGPEWRQGLVLALALPRSAAAWYAGWWMVMSSTAKTYAALAGLLLMLAGAWLVWPASGPDPGRGPAGGDPAGGASAGQPQATPAAADATPGPQSRSVVAAAPAAAAATVVPGRALIGGHVLDAAGRPLPGVEVGLRAYGAGVDPIGEHVPGRATSDALGAFSIEVDPGRAVVPVATGAHVTLRAMPWVPGAPDARAGELVLVAAAAATLRGRVVDDAGAPLSGARVAVLAMALGEFPRPLEFAIAPQFAAITTGADGAFEAARVPVAGGVDVLFSRAGYAPRRMPSQEVASGYRLVELEKLNAAAGRVHGIVLDGAGRPIGGAALSLGHRQSTTSRADGAFELEFAAAPARLLATAPGRRAVTVEDVGEHTPMPLVVELAAPALAIEGQVVDADGNGMAGLFVTLADPERAAPQTSVEWLCQPAGIGAQDLPEGAMARTDPTGRFVVEGLGDRDYSLRVWDQRTAAAIESPPVAAGSRGVQLRWPAAPLLAELAGVVVDRDGRGVPGATVSTHLLASNMPIAIVPGPWTQTDAAGRFVLPAVPRRYASVAVNGGDLVYTKVDVEELLARPEVRFVVCRRLHVRIEGPVGTVVRFLDERGVALFLQSSSHGRAMSTNAWQLRASPSPVLALSEAAVTMTWSRDGEEVGRMPIELQVGAAEVSTLRVPR